MKTPLLILFIAVFIFMPVKAQNSRTNAQDISALEERLAQQKQMQRENVALAEALRRVKPKLIEGNPIYNSKLYAEEGKKLAESGFSSAAAVLAKKSKEAMSGTISNNANNQKYNDSFNNTLENNIRRQIAEQERKERMDRTINTINEIKNDPTSYNLLTKNEQQELINIENKLNKKSNVLTSQQPLEKKQQPVKNSLESKQPRQLERTEMQQPVKSESTKPEEPIEDLTPYYKRIAELKEKIAQLKARK